ncbi:MAG: hypothetical protein KGM49_00555 [Sphingomonadales bacterium]|nr:hypothetical protein [Sphingomonadales bacterium]
MTLALRWRVPPPAIQTRWRGPAGMIEAVRRDPLGPIAAVIGPPGATGVQGPAGPQGPQGAPRRFDFTSSATWIGEHDLGRLPIVQVYLETGEPALADTVATPINFTVTHADARTGFVLLI